jgi:hypothetical protein
MQKILIIPTLMVLSSCSTLIMNQGFKSYKSDIIKTKEYKNANHFQQDLLYLNDLCTNSFPDIDNIFPKQQRESIIDSLLNLLSEKGVDEQVFKGYIRFYLSHYENQHTVIAGYFGVGLFPYLLNFVDNKWYLWDINNDYDSLLIGKRVIRINNEPIDNIEKKLFQYVSAENEITKRNEIWFMNRPSLLKQYGIIDQTDSILISFENGEKVWVKSIRQDKDIHFHLGDKRLVPNPITKYSDYNYNMTLYPNDNYAYFQFNRCFDKVDAYESIHDYVKPWIVPFAKLYLSVLIKRKKNPNNDIGFKLDFDRLVFKDYLKLMFDSLHKQGIGNLIIDLRNNGGGSSLICNQLLYYLTDKEDLKDFSKMYYMSDFNKQMDKKKYNNFTKTYIRKNNSQPEKGKLYPYGFFNCDSLLFEKIESSKSPYYIPKNRKVFNGKVIVLANYRTGSAAALLTTLLQDNNIAIVIGTSVGNNPIGATEYHPYKLPNTKASGSVASSYLIRPKPSNGKILTPDYWIENSVDDMINGKDKYLGKAMDLIKK